MLNETNNHPHICLLFFHISAEFLTELQSKNRMWKLNANSSSFITQFQCEEDFRKIRNNALWTFQKRFIDFLSSPEQSSVNKDPQNHLLKILAMQNNFNGSINSPSKSFYDCFVLQVLHPPPVLPFNGKTFPLDPHNHRCTTKWRFSGGDWNSETDGECNIRAILLRICISSSVLLFLLVTLLRFSFKLPTKDEKMKMREDSMCSWI